MHLGIFLNLQLPQIIDLFLFNILITVLPYIDSCHIRNFQLSTEKNLQNGKYYKSRHCVPYQTFIWNALGFAQISDWTLTWVLLDVIVRVWFAIRVTGGSSTRMFFYNPDLSVKVHVFLEGHKNWWNLHRRFDSYYMLSNWRWRFCHFMWPSQKTWTLISTAEFSSFSI